MSLLSRCVTRACLFIAQPLQFVETIPSRSTSESRSYSPHATVPSWHQAFSARRVALGSPVSSRQASAAHRTTTLHSQDLSVPLTGPQRSAHRTSALHSQDLNAPLTEPERSTHRTSALHSQDLSAPLTGPQRSTHRTSSLHSLDLSAPLTGPQRSAHRTSALDSAR